jgi:8-oxo-dGTP pyrophosphatase MutT (NUDIX family)
MKWPRIRSRRTTAVSPWMSIIAREVEFSRGAPVEVYHAVEQADYIAIVAVTRGGKIPIVRQYRPALETFSWELPAGLVDPGEKPVDCARRELMEETGLVARAIHPLGETSPCTGRLSNRIHSFFVEAGERIALFEPEPGLRVKLVSPAEVARLIQAGTFTSQLHIGALLLAELHGFLALPRRPPRRKRVRQTRRKANSARNPRANRS